MKQNTLLKLLRKNGYFIDKEGIRKKCDETYSLNLTIDNNLNSQSFPLSLVFAGTNFEFEVIINKSKDCNSLKSIPKTILSYEILDSANYENGKEGSSKKRKGYCRNFDPSKDYFYDLDCYIIQNNEKKPFLILRQELVTYNKSYSQQFLNQEAKKLGFYSRFGFMNMYRVATSPPENILKNRNDPTLVYWTADCPDPPYWKEDFQTDGKFRINDIILKGEIIIKNSTINFYLSAETVLKIQANEFRSKNIVMGDPFSGETIIHNKVNENHAFVIFEKNLVIENRNIKVRKLAMDGFAHVTIINGNLELHGRYRKQQPQYCNLFEISSDNETEYITQDSLGRLNKD